MGPGEEELRELRQVGDPPADELVSGLYAAGQIDAVNRLLVALLRNDQPPPASLPSTVQDFLAHAARLPHWADPELILAGQRAFMERGPVCLSALSLASLPECYCLRNGVHVLTQTQRLTQHAERRIYETAQMLVDVMTPGGLDPAGRGVRAAQRVRLLHASIRYLLRADPCRKSGLEPFAQVLLRTPWNDAWGVPICQADMAYTILTFSWVVVRTLRVLGHHLSEHEETGFIHVWAVVGHLMGVRDELLPRTPKTAENLFEAIKAQQKGPTPEGRALTRAVMDAMRKMARGRVARVLTTRRMIRVMMTEFLPAETAQILDVRPLNAFERLVSRRLFNALAELTSALDRLSHRERVLRFVERQIATAVVLHLSQLPRGGERGLFAMPEELLAPPRP
jgi:hypothetical protein